MGEGHSNCRRCDGTGVIQVQNGTTYTTDSEDEIALAYHDEPCPACPGRIGGTIKRVPRNWPQRRFYLAHVQAGNKWIVMDRTINKGVEFPDQTIASMVMTLLNSVYEEVKAEMDALLTAPARRSRVADIPDADIRDEYGVTQKEADDAVLDFQPMCARRCCAEAIVAACKPLVAYAEELERAGIPATEHIANLQSYDDAEECTVGALYEIRRLVKEWEEANG